MKFKTTHLVPFLIASAVILLVCIFELLPASRGDGRGPDEIKANFLQRLEWISYDWRVRLAHHFGQPAATNLGFVAISDKTIEEVISGKLGYQYGLYWPRHVYGCVVRELKQQGARAIGFDILFGELRPDHNRFKIADGSEQMTSDQFFARQLAEAGNVILASTPGVMPPSLFRANADGLGDITVEKDSDGILRKAKAFRESEDWSPLVLAQAKALDLDLGQGRTDAAHHCIVFTRLDGSEPYSLPLRPDGAIDVEALGEPPGGPAQFPRIKRRTWNMGIALAAAVLRLDLDNAVIEKGRILLRGPKGVERVIPVDKDNCFYIDWSLTESDPRLAQKGMETLLALDHDRGSQGFEQWVSTNGYRNLLTEWKGKVVVVGSIATGNDLTDRGATPLQKDTCLVNKHWNVANSMLVNRFIHPPSKALELALVICLGYLAALLSWKLRGFWAAFWVAGLALVYMYVSGFCFVRWRIWMPTAVPLLGGLVLNYVCVISYGAVFEQRERRRVRSVFSKIVSPEVVQELLSAKQLALGGARKNLTVYFADVRGFTGFTDSTHAQAEEFVRKQQLDGKAAEAFLNQQATETLATVNLYLGIIAETVLRHKGTLDKYIGDCVMAFWGAPVENRQHAVDCVRAAIEAQRRIDEVNRDRFAENERRKKMNEARVNGPELPLPLLPILAVGTGINTGLMTIGLMGSDRHILNYTVFGREVNVASRLEGVSGRSRIFITESTFLEVQRDDPELAGLCVRLAPVAMKGFRDPVQVFEVPWKAAPKIISGISAELTPLSGVREEGMKSGGNML